MTNGNKISKETLIPVSLFLIAITFVATIAMSWQARTSDIETLQATVTEIKKQLEDRSQKLANYRAQVDVYRTEDYEQREQISELFQRIAKLEQGELNETAQRR